MSFDFIRYKKEFFCILLKIKIIFLSILSRDI